MHRSDQAVTFTDRTARKLNDWMRSQGLPPYLDELFEARIEAFEKQLREVGIAVPMRSEGLPVRADGRPDKRRAPRKAKPLKPKSLRDHLKVIRGLVRFGLRRGMIERDPSAGYELPAGESPEVEIYTPEELGLLYADPDPDLAEIWRFMTHTCLRIGEFTWLLKDDVLMDGNGRPKALLVRRKVCPQTGRTWQPKHKLNRVVSLTPEAAAIVAKRLSTSKVPWLFEAPETVTTQVGKWRGSRLLTRLRVRQRAVGITHGGLHTFRHMGCTFFANHPTNPLPCLCSRNSWVTGASSPRRSICTSRPMMSASHCNASISTISAAKWRTSRRLIRMVVKAENRKENRNGISSSHLHAKLGCRPVRKRTGTIAPSEDAFLGIGRQECVRDLGPCWGTRCKIRPSPAG